MRFKVKKFGTDTLESTKFDTQPYYGENYDFVQAHNQHEFPFSISISISLLSLLLLLGCQEFFLTSINVQTAITTITCLATCSSLPIRHDEMQKEPL